MFIDSAEAKGFAVKMTNRMLTQDEAINKLQYLKSNYEKAYDEESRQLWSEMASDLEEWLESEEYKNGDYPQGIDDLVINLIEWRATIYALQHTDTKATPFRDYLFFNQWLIGSIYATHSLFGKLVSADKRENSLRNLWWKVCKFIRKDKACVLAEYKEICSSFCNEQPSKSLLLRNKVIAHNEKNLKHEWDDLDTEIRKIVRIWSIIISWSSFGIISPFHKSDQAFQGLEHFFDDQEMALLHHKRQEYIDLCIHWSRTFLHNDEHDDGGYFIANISMNMRSVGINL